MATKVVKTLAVTGLGQSYPIMGGPIDMGMKAPPVNASTFEDTVKTKIPNPQPEYSPIKFKVGHNNLPRPLVGTASVTISATFSDGTGTSQVIAGFITSVEPSSVEVGGERVPAWEIEFEATGTNYNAAPSTTTSTTTTTTAHG